MASWAAASPEARLGVCMEIVDRLYDGIFETAQAVMHTAGQSAPMSYAGSGTNALDRGVEALAYAHAAMADVPREALWERRFGSTTIRLRKRYRLVPRGVAVCFACATFPTWNAYPAMLASLATGNAVIVKPHPTAILPMALAVRTCRAVLSDAGFAPDLVTLCLDTIESPVGKILVKHPRTAIVDFTGSARFGAWVEANAHPALCYSETSGVNTVVVESVDELEPVLKSLATTMSLFSAQMCTSPQNVYVPRDGVRHRGGRISGEEFGEALAQAMTAIADDPRRAAPILAAIQSPSTLALIDRIADGRRTPRTACCAPRRRTRTRSSRRHGHAHHCCSPSMRALGTSTAKSVSDRSVSSSRRTIATRPCRRRRTTRAPGAASRHSCTRPMPSMSNVPSMRIRRLARSSRATSPDRCRSILPRPTATTT